MSVSLAERAARFIPGGTQTYSKARSQFPSNAPSHILRGEAAYVLGSDDRWYVDWTMGLGAISLGYHDPGVDAAVRAQVDEGSIFGLAHPVEVELAEALAPLMPWGDPMVRYGKNGSDVTSAAVRAARAITGRQIVVSQGYHGWQDWSCPNRRGTAEPDRVIRCDGFPMVSDQLMRELAAVIIEPDAIEHMRPAGLAVLRAQCDMASSLLIFDEVLTGFRYPGFTYATYAGVTPDLICLGKAIANGFPLSVVTGQRKYMEVFGGGIGYSMTFGGETLSLAAAIATLRTYSREPVIERLWAVGRAVQDHWNAEAARLGLDIPCDGDPPRSVVRYPSPAHKTLVMERMFALGIMFTVGFTACYAHTERDVERTNAATTSALEALAAAGAHPEQAVEGEVVGGPYRR